MREEGATHAHNNPLSALGLESDPFLDHADPRYFYAEPAIMQRLDLLVHLTQFSETLLVVTGEPGSGKTAVLEQFIAHGNENWRLCRLNARADATIGNIHGALAEGLGVGLSAVPTRAEILQRCQALREAGQLPILVVDDAERLPLDAIDELLSLAGDPRATLQHLRIVLFGEPELENRLRQSRFGLALEALQQTLDLPRFPETQAAAYLMYRLTVAGYSGRSPFSATEVRGIYKAANGLPGRMNAHASEALLEHAQRVAASGGDQAEPLSGRPWLRWATSLGLVGLVVGGAWFASQQLLTEPAVESNEPQAQALILPAPVVRQPPEGEAVPPESPPVKMPPPRSEPLVQPKPASRASESAPQEPPAAAKPAAEDRPESIPVPAAPPPTLAITEPTRSPPPKPPEPAAPAEAPEPPEPAVPAQAPEPTTPVEPSRIARAPAKPALQAPPPAPKASPAAALPAEGGLHREAWIRSQPAGHYTLQLLGTRKEDSVGRFIRDHELEGELAYFRRLHDGADWFTLLYGSFPSRAAAEAAVAGLPAPIRTAKPWPRTFASVQAQLPANP